MSPNPDCKSCVSDADRALWKRLADEIDDYLEPPEDDGLDFEIPRAMCDPVPPDEQPDPQRAMCDPLPPDEQPDPPPTLADPEHP